MIIKKLYTDQLKIYINKTYDRRVFMKNYICTILYNFFRLKNLNYLNGKKRRKPKET